MTVAGFALEESHQICVATPAFSNSNTAQLEATGWLMSDQIPTQLNSCNLHLAGGDSLLPHPRSWLDEAPGDPQQRERGWVAGAALPSTVSALPQLLGNPEINFIGRTKKTQTCRNMLCEKSLESAISIRLEPPRAEQDRTNEPQHWIQLTGLGNIHIWANPSHRWWTSRQFCQWPWRRRDVPGSPFQSGLDTSALMTVKFYSFRALRECQFVGKGWAGQVNWEPGTSQGQHYTEVLGSIQSHVQSRALKKKNQNQTGRDMNLLEALPMCIQSTS